MASLDDINTMRGLDVENVYDSVVKLPDQFRQAWDDIKAIDVPRTCYLAHNIVVVGMGGSALGERVIDSLTSDKIRVPMEVFTEYHVPRYVNEKSLVIVSSYSGNTEEAISAGKEALQKDAQVFILTSGGKLKDFMDEYKLAGYLFNPIHNPSNQPRMALGYNVGAMMALLSKCGFYDLDEDGVNKLLYNINMLIQKYAIDLPESENTAKQLAAKLHDQIPIFFASEHTVGAVHAFRNQINETAKTFATYFEIPEMNHHLMEGLKYPAKAKEILKFVFFESDLYAKKVIQRYGISASIAKEEGFDVITHKLRGENKLLDVFEIITLGSFVQFYMAMLRNINPAPVPIVDRFKEELAKVQ